MRVLVTDGDSRPALAAVRALGRQGHEVIVASERIPCLASVSKYAAASERVPSPVNEATGFENALMELVHRQHVQVVLPITEISTLLVTERQQQLPAFCRVPFPSAAVVSNAANKAHVIQLAERLGVPIPRSVIVSSADEGVGRRGELSYPAVVKPARSRVRVGSGWISTGVRYATDARDLTQILYSLPAETFPILLQERIEGPGVGLFACFDDGHATAMFAHRRLREKPPSGGVSVLSESTPLDPAAVEYSQRLLSELGWRGVAMVEFKRDDRDGQLRLMEINGRFWGSLELAIAAGVDFPSLALDVAVGTSPLAPAQLPYWPAIALARRRLGCADDDSEAQPRAASIAGVAPWQAPDPVGLAAPLGPGPALRVGKYGRPRTRAPRMAPATAGPLNCAARKAAECVTLRLHAIDASGAGAD